MKPRQFGAAAARFGIEVAETPDHQAPGGDLVEKGKVAGFAMDDLLLFGLTVEPVATRQPKNDPEFKRLVASR